VWESAVCVQPLENLSLRAYAYGKRGYATTHRQLPICQNFVRLENTKVKTYLTLGYGGWLPLLFDTATLSQHRHENSVLAHSSPPQCRGYHNNQCSGVILSASSCLR
ncbi:unnamed protein product, partial [Ectocarpus sp. 13 AM-2016]